MLRLSYNGCGHSCAESNEQGRERHRMLYAKSTESNHKRGYKWTLFNIDRTKQFCEFSAYVAFTKAKNGQTDIKNTNLRFSIFLAQSTGDRRVLHYQGFKQNVLLEPQVQFLTRVIAYDTFHSVLRIGEEMQLNGADSRVGRSPVSRRSMQSGYVLIYHSLA